MANLGQLEISAYRSVVTKIICRIISASEY